MNYVVELLHANDGVIDGECIFVKMKVVQDIYIYPKVMIDVVNPQVHGLPMQ